ncbi:MAG: dTDP-4-dehydrorhamnose reductase, partial [Clostridia bacterium]|nr:dTDP-4-dehydrorhamnose reductase [Clostridia bacterium]
QLDITDEAAVFGLLETLQPDAVIHCAAWTAVDAAEAEENREKVYAVNVKGTEHIAKACRKNHATMMYISTDYIFDGQGSEPWEPDCERFSPINVYGQTKLEGELAVRANLEAYFIVRIAWVFGKNGKNFIRTMLRLGETRDTLRVVDDQIGTPTYTLDLARLLADMIESDKYGIYHATNEGGYISWAEFAKAIFEAAHMNVRVIPVSSAEYGLSVAARPANSRLDKSKLVRMGFKLLPEWRDALYRFIASVNGD